MHLLHEELFSELRAGGFIVEPGQLGENVTTAGIALLELSEGTRLQLGSEVIVRITGLRNPCSQIDDFQSGLLRAVLGRTDSGELIRKTGVMGVVEVGGRVHPGDAITVIGVPGAHVPLQPV